MQLHGGLDKEEQQRVFKECSDPTNTRVILSTNIAECSVTISNVKIVIDTGYHKQARYNPQKKLTEIVKERISQSSARQRSGRAGRIAPGYCYRIYSEEIFSEMESERIPEIQRISLDFAMLKLIQFGIQDVKGFDYIDKPEEEALDVALRNLKEIGALNLKGGQLEVTWEGRFMMEI